MSAASIGDWFRRKYQRRQAESGTFVTATAMRKQGVPIEVALAILVGRVA